MELVQKLNQFADAIDRDTEKILKADLEAAKLRQAKLVPHEVEAQKRLEEFKALREEFSGVYEAAMKVNLEEMLARAPSTAAHNHLSRFASARRDLHFLLSDHRLAQAQAAVEEIAQLDPDSIAVKRNVEDRLNSIPERQSFGQAQNAMDSALENYRYVTSRGGGDRIVRFTETAVPQASGVKPDVKKEFSVFSSGRKE